MITLDTLLTETFSMLLSIIMMYIMMRFLFKIKGIGEPYSMAAIGVISIATLLYMTTLH